MNDTGRVIERWTAKCIRYIEVRDRRICSLHMYVYKYIYMCVFVCVCLCLNVCVYRLVQ